MTTLYDDRPDDDQQEDQSEVLFHEYSRSRLLDAATDLARHCGYSLRHLTEAIAEHFAAERRRAEGV